MTLSNDAVGNLRRRATTIGRCAVKCRSPADAAIAMLYDDISFLTKHGTGEDAELLSLQLGRELLAYCRENFCAVDLERLRHLIDEILAESKGATA